MYLCKLVFLLISITTFAPALEPTPEPSTSKYDYDLIVIGGGSGGLAASKDAYLKYHKRVLVIDYVKPSPRGTFWGAGGACVNVGCIPKKLMHQTALIGEAVKDADKYGYEIKDPEKIKLNWATLIQAVQDHVRSTNWVLKTQLTSKKLKKVTDFINGLGEFVDANTIKVTMRDQENVKTSQLSDTTKLVTAEKILIAVGGRPDFPPNINGLRNLAITSDDLFSLKTPPGKTLILGAGYIGMEVAGFLRGMGFDVTVMARSEVLRGFDKQMVKLIREDLVSRGIAIFDKTEVVSITEEFTGKISFFQMLLSLLGRQSPQKRYLRVKWRKITGEGKAEEGEGLWETVLVATGRRAATAELKVENAKIEVQSNGKIKTTNEQTNIPNIYAVGDVLYEKPELTPTAILAGRLLMDRLYGGGTVQMDYDLVPTTVFLPREYSYVGLNEEKAIAKYGLEKLEVYHQKFTPLEYVIPAKGKANCYLKVICLKEGDQRIVGLHYFGPNAGEVMQGYAAAMKAGLTFKQLHETTGIHPTVSEEFTRVYITKSSGEDPTPQSCCS